MPIPDRILNAPELQEGLELFYQAFLELSSCRHIGFGAGPIPWLAIQKYCEVYEIEDEQRYDLFYHLNKMDAAYLHWEEERSKKK